MRSRGAFLYINLGFSRRRFFYTLMIIPVVAIEALKKTQEGVLVFGGESKKEGVGGFGACT